MRLPTGIAESLWVGRRDRCGCAVSALLAAFAAAAMAAEAPASAARTDLPVPPMPPLAASGPPPADPWPSLYRGAAAAGSRWLLTLVAAPAPPVLKSGQPCTIQPRPHDIVQAPGDPEPVEGTVREEPDGRISFYNLKGIGHKRNPLAVAELLVFKRQATTVQAALRERVEQAGKDPSAHLALAQECIDGDLVAEAEAELLRALELDPKHLAARLKLADLYASLGRLDAEVGVCQAALAAGADSPEIRERLARRCFELDLFALAETHFRDGFALAAKAPAAEVATGKAPLPAEPLARRLLRGVAEVLVVQGRLTEAASLLAALAKAAPDDLAVRNVQALADILGGRPEKAAELLAPMAEAKDAPVSALNNLGAVLFNTGDAAAALPHFEACLAAAPRHVKAILNAALASAATGQLGHRELASDRAQKLLAALAPPPANSLHYTLVAGYVQERLGKPDAALAAWQQARTLDRSCAYAVLGLARGAAAKGDLRTAGERFEEARLLAPDDPQALRGLGACRYRAGLFAGAADVFRQLAARDPAEPSDLVRLGIALLPLDDSRGQATVLFEKALAASHGTDPYALVARAYVAHAAGSTSRSEALLRQAQRALDAPEAAKYAADALRRLYAARGEESTTTPFAGAALPQGWRATGEGSPSPEPRQGELHFEGASPAPNERAVVRTVPRAAPADGGPGRGFARFEIDAHAPLTNDATVGVLLGVGQATCQVALRTTRTPQLSRRLAYRILRGPTATPWADLPGTIALEDLRLGVGLSARAPEALDVCLDGAPLGSPISLDALHEPPAELTIGFFAAVEPGQQCLFGVREAEIVWRKPPEK